MTSPSILSSSPLLQPRSQGLSSLRPRRNVKRRDPGNEVPSSLASESKKKCREPLVIRLINGSLKICEGNENLTTKLLLNSNYLFLGII